MPNEAHSHPCAALQVLQGQVDNLERRIDVHDAHLAALDTQIATLVKLTGETTAGLRVLETKVDALERWQGMQNSHLAAIDKHLEEMNTAIGNNRQERSAQIGDLRTTVEGKFTDLFRAGVIAVVPILAGLVYIILGHVLGK